MNNFYVYQHIRLDTNEVFYVGKGFGDRAYRNYGRSKYWHNIVKKYGYKIEFVDTNLDELTAFKLEVETIKSYGRKDLGLGNLINLTNGGEGLSGLIVSSETRAKIKASNLGKTGDKSPNFGKTFSTEHKIKLSFAHIGKTPSIETKTKMSAAHFGKTHSVETRLKLSAANLGKTFSIKHKAKISAAKIGKYTGDKSPMAKKVTNQFGDVFNTIKDAAIWCNSTHICDCCKGKRNYSGKHPITGEKLIWKYL